MNLTKYNDTRLRRFFVIGRPSIVAAAWLLIAFVAAAPCDADDFIPRAQDRPPGPALSPDEAIRAMTVPEGFTVELVASEPDIVNPVAMTFDEQGRIWVTESLEYPRREPGPGRDRIKILEDTTGDGRADKVTLFAEGLNIPSGIAVGYGGAWVGNAPDLLFLQDTDGDGRADKQEVVVTGFGRHDTHELPNAFTWGPDGWLYGLNGVYNPCRIEHQGKTHEFTCAMFRIHPKTRAFEVFCEGTSNPWGVAFNDRGSAFVCACVIDHLWHLVEGAYYQRQAGAYPPFTALSRSIVDHRHQKAAYCGLTYFDSDAYPDEYRGHLYMGNIHGGCINVDVLEQRGANYFATPRPDFLTANDAWFMPVAQKVGPDGCLYVLDWYDRYHCYQDAGRDPNGVDRGHGRLYRVRYGNAPRPKQVNLAAATDVELIGYLRHPNIYYRETAQRILSERATPQVRQALQQSITTALDLPIQEFVDDALRHRTQTLHAIWALLGCGEIDAALHLKLLDHADDSIRAWGVRAAGNQRQVSAAVLRQVQRLVADAAAEVRLQVAVAATKLFDDAQAIAILETVARAPHDALLSQVTWQQVRQLSMANPALLADMWDRAALEQESLFNHHLSHTFDLVFAQSSDDPVLLRRFMQTALGKVGQGEAGKRAAAEAIGLLAGKIQSGELAGDQLISLRQNLAATLAPFLNANGDDPISHESILLAASWQDSDALAHAGTYFSDENLPMELRLRALQALVAADHASLRESVPRVLADRDERVRELQISLLDALGRMQSPWVAEVVLAAYFQLAAELRPRVIELLTGRDVWAHALMDAVEKHQISAAVVSVNQLGKLMALKDLATQERAQRLFGRLRLERNADREQVINEIRTQLSQSAGDPHHGERVFAKVCAQCHKIHGQGVDVGPDITVNGRASLEQLLSNVLDPSLIIGPAYQAYTISTEDGRVLMGLLVENSPQRIVLKVQGGKQEIVPRDQIDQMQSSPLSMMPEGLEKQLSPQEVVDLFAFLRLDKPPTDPAAKQIPDRQ